MSRRYGSIFWFLFFVMVLFFLTGSFAKAKGKLPDVKKQILFLVRKISRIKISMVHAAVGVTLLSACVFNASAVLENRTIEETIQHDIDLKNKKSLAEISLARQDIRIDAETVELALFFYKEDSFDGSIHVYINQNEKKVYEKNIYADSIDGDSKCSLNISGLEKGKYTIFVEGVKQDNSSVSLVLSRQKLFDSAQINGEAYDGNIALSMKTSIVPKAHRYRVCLAACFFFLIGIVFWHILRRKQNAHVYYFSAAFLIGITICIQFPCLSITPEPIAETGSNFYQMTYLLGIKGSLFLDDAGYWPLFQRLAADFIIHIVKQRRYAVFWMQACAVLFVSFACARFCRKQYRIYAADSVRFAVSLFSGTAYAAAFGDKCLSFHNAAYFGVILLLFNMLLDFGQLSRMEFLFITIESVLICLSKGRYGVFFPLYLIVLAGYLGNRICCQKKRRHIDGPVLRRQAAYMLSTAAGACVQTVYMLSYMTKWDTHTGGMFQVLTAGFYYFIQSFVTIFIPHSPLEWNGWMVHICSALLLAGCAALLCRNWKARKNLCAQIIVILIFIMGSSMMNAVMQNEYKSYAWSRICAMTLDRTNIFMITGAVFALFLFCLLIREKRIREWAFGMLLITMSLRFTALKDFRVCDNCMLQADWSNYYHLFSKESYVIPLWDGNRFMVKNASVLYLGSKPEEEIDTSQWNYTTGPTKIEQIDFPYSTSDTFVSAALKNQSIHAIYAEKTAVGMDGNIYAVLYDENGSLLCRQKALPAEQRLHIGFLFEEPVQKAAKIAFEDAAGNAVSVRTDLLIGIEENIEESMDENTVENEEK